jgi:predicted alpha/beta superfamily hydrolase
MSWDIGIHLNGIRFTEAEWNYTHNTNAMMREAGYDWIYQLDGEKVIDTLPKFKAMLANLKAHPEYYRALNPANGWGNYDRLVHKWENEILPRAEEIAAKVPEAQWWEWS